MWEITPAKSASIRQPHWHRQLDVKRPTRRSATPDSPEVLFWEPICTFALLLRRGRLGRHRVNVGLGNVPDATRLRCQLLDLGEVALHLAPAVPQRVIRA